MNVACQREVQTVSTRIAVLKFSLDKFFNIIWGFPVEIETDCPALRDVMLNDKLNAVHAQW